MHPILIKVGPFSVYSYGLMIALGFGLSALLIYKRAGSFGLDKDKILDLLIIILVSGIIGARVLYVLLNIKFYLARPVEILNLSNGGLVWYGGFASGVFALILYSNKKRINFWAVSDLISPYLAMGQALGRIGCFLNGCCYGMVVSSGYPFAVTFPGDFISRHPAQIYSSVALLAIFIILRILQDLRRFDGEVFLAYCALYSCKRFLMEFLRADNPKIILGLTLSQALSCAVFLAAADFFIAGRKYGKRSL